MFRCSIDGGLLPTFVQIAGEKLDKAEDAKDSCWYMQHVCVCVQEKLLKIDTERSKQPHGFKRVGILMWPRRLRNELATQITAFKGIYDVLAKTHGDSAQWDAPPTASSPQPSCVLSASEGSTGQASYGST